jgi:hypothetical protein
MKYGLFDITRTQTIHRCGSLADYPQVEHGDAERLLASLGVKGSLQPGFDRLRPTSSTAPLSRSKLNG